MANITFLQLQQRFAEAHGDTSSVWAVGGSSNKQALNDAWDDLYDDVRQDMSTRMKMKTQKTLVTITNKIGQLPADFLEIAETGNEEPIFPAVYLRQAVDFYSPVDSNCYRIRWDATTGNYFIDFDSTPQAPIYIEYIPQSNALSADGDVPKIIPQFQPFIVDYAMTQYFKRQRDWSNYGQSAQIAKSLLSSQVNKMW